MRALFLALLLLSPIAHAKIDPKVAARQHFDRAKELYKMGRYAEAIDEFRAADRFVPSPLMTFNIGLAQDKLGQCTDAIASYERYLQAAPSATNRAETEQKISDQRAKLERRECAEQRSHEGPKIVIETPGAQSPPPPVAPPPAVQVPPAVPGQPLASGPPPALELHRGYAAGRHAFGIGLAAGPAIGGLGSGKGLTEPDDNNNNFQLEKTVGFHLEASFLFPIVRLIDGRTLLQGEGWLAYTQYGFEAAVAAATMEPIEGSARMTSGGFAVRANLPISSRLPVVLAPAIGGGFGTQFMHFEKHGCDERIDNIFPTGNILIDLGARVELGHHAITLSPAKIHILMPAVGDGNINTVCGLFAQEVPADQFWGVDKTKLNITVDLGYAFLF